MMVCVKRLALPRNQGTTVLPCIAKRLRDILKIPFCAQRRPSAEGLSLCWTANGGYGGLIVRVMWCDPQAATGRRNKAHCTALHQCTSQPYAVQIKLPSRPLHKRHSEEHTAFERAFKCTSLFDGATRMASLSASCSLPTFHSRGEFGMQDGFSAGKQRDVVR